MTTSTRKQSEQFHPKVIKTTEEYESALERVEELFTATPGTAEGDELELLLLLIETYEAKEFPIDLPDPVEAIRFRMEQADLQQKDLVPIFGTKGKVSEVLNRKRDLSLSMIRKLVAELDIPAEVLLQERGARIVDGDFLALGKQFPLTEMYKRGWFKGIVATLQEAKDQIDDVLVEFASPVGNSAKHLLLNRQNLRCGSRIDDAALLAWKIRVMSLAAKEEIPVYKPGTVNEPFLDQVVKLSYFDDGPKLAAEFLRKSGIHLIIERHLPKTFLDGAAMRMSENSRIVALTLRHDRLDNFWFVLLHELAHVALHIDTGRCESIVDDLDAASTEKIEMEADALASESLIPESEWRTSSVRKNPSIQSIIEFAEALRIHPAIPAGRIRRELNDYKKFSRLVGNRAVRKMFCI